MRTILAIAMMIGTGSFANSYLSQPRVRAFDAMVGHQQSAPTRPLSDGTGYYGQGSATGGPSGGLPDRN